MTGETKLLSDRYLLIEELDEIKDMINDSYLDSLEILSKNNRISFLAINTAIDNIIREQRELSREDTLIASGVSEDYIDIQRYQRNKRESDKES